MNPATQPAFGLYLVLTEPVAGYEVCAEAAVEAGLRKFVESKDALPYLP